MLPEQGCSEIAVLFSCYKRLGMRDDYLDEASGVFQGRDRRAEADTLRKFWT